MTTPRKSFCSDNYSAAHPDVLRAITAVNTGDVTAYGDDRWTGEVAARLCRLTGAAGAFFVFTGTAANVLGLSLMLRPFEGIICADSAHLDTDECGAGERILGSKLMLVPSPDGKLTPELIATRLDWRGDQHRVQPRVVAIAQVTELGTCYTLAELARLREFCRAEGLYLYADGARLANAAAYLGCGLSDLAAHADVLSFGGTKNGALGAETVLVMRSELVPDVRFLRKQQMQLASKMRFLSAQFDALLTGDLWLRNAAHANAMARRLADRIAGLPGVSLRYPVESNAVFAALPPAQIAELQPGWDFYIRHPAEHVVRWMTSFSTSEADVDEFAAAIAGVASSFTA